MDRGTYSYNAVGGGGLKEEFVLRAVRHIISIFDLDL